MQPFCFAIRSDLLREEHVRLEVRVLEAGVGPSPVGGRKIVGGAEPPGQKAAAERAVGDQRGA